MINRSELPSSPEFMAVRCHDGQCESIMKRVGGDNINGLQRISVAWNSDHSQNLWERLKVCKLGDDVTIQANSFSGCASKQSW